jgi:hypothetical protein
MVERTLLTHAAVRASSGDPSERLAGGSGLDDR